MNVATFLRRRHGVLALCDFESVFLCGLVEFYSFDLSVFLFDVTSLATGDLNRADSRLSLLVQSIVLFVCMYKVYVLVMTLSQSKSRKFIEGCMHTFQRIQSLVLLYSLTLSIANLGRAKRNSLIPSLSSNPLTILNGLKMSKKLIAIFNLDIMPAASMQLAIVRSVAYYRFT